MGVQFEDEQFSSVRMNARPPSTGLAGRLIKAGWAKDAKQANMFLLAGAVILLIISVMLYSNTRPTPPKYDPSADIIGDEI